MNNYENKSWAKLNEKLKDLQKIIKKKKIFQSFRIENDEKFDNFKPYSENFLLLNHNSKNIFSDDKTKIVFSNSFRKLAYKTQVFFNNHGDYNRTRLTHSLEVAEISKTICGFLGLNAELSECISLSHDLGHTPFGHSGEDGLNFALKSFDFEEFNHNVQSLKIVTILEKRCKNFSGLNLSPYILDALIKHNGAIKKNCISENSKFIFEICEIYKIDPSLQTSLEGQIASISDDIAYTNHDLEDGWRAGFISIHDIKDLPIINEFIVNDLKVNPLDSEKNLIYSLVSYLKNFMIIDCLENFLNLIEENAVKNIHDILNAEFFLFNFSEKMKKSRAEIKKFLFKKYYRNPALMIQGLKMENIIQGLFKFYFQNPLCLPYEWQSLLSDDNIQKKNVICNFIAGMTDRYALSLHDEIFK